MRISDGSSDVCSSDRNMAVADLVLGNPVEYDQWRLAGIAHDTGDIIERIRHVDTLDEALADCVYVAGYTARRRAAKWTLDTPRESAASLLDRAADGTVAVLFGREARKCGV